MVQAEAEIVARGVEDVDAGAVKAHAGMLRELIVAAGVPKRNGFLCTFVETITVDRKWARMRGRAPREGAGPEGRSPTS